MKYTWLILFFCAFYTTDGQCSPTCFEDTSGQYLFCHDEYYEEKNT